MEDIYNTHEYKQSRKAYIAQCAFEYFIMLLVADAFLANLLTSGGNCDFCNKKLYDYCRASRNGVPCGRVVRKWLRNEVESN